MKGEINRDFYCAQGHNKNKQKDICHNSCSYYPCDSYHRKWPTPEQFKEEYGDDYRDDCPAWFVSKDDSGIDWVLVNYGYTKRFDNIFVVCVCTPWGKPPNNWRPE